MCYANLVLARGLERFAGELADARHQRADRARPAARGGAGGARGVRRAPASRSSRSSRRRRPTSGSPRSARQARGFVYTVSRHRHDRRARGRSDRRCAGSLARVGAHSRRARSRVGFGIATPEQAAAAADAGADGVIVGSRLVRAAAEAASAGGSRRRGRRELVARARRRARVAPRAAWGSSSPRSPASSVWIVLWALGAKAFDAFLITMLIVLLAAPARARHAATCPAARRGRAR